MYVVAYIHIHMHIFYNAFTDERALNHRRLCHANIFKWTEGNVPPRRRTHSLAAGCRIRASDRTRVFIREISSVKIGI